jgi:hypothetical protein
VTPVELVTTLEQDTDALIAVWVSTIDKIFGKPYLLQPAKKPNRKDSESEETHQQACQKLHDNYVRKQNHYQLRQKILEAAFKKMCSRLPTQLHDEAQNKWTHKQNLSSQLDTSKNIGCKQGKHYSWFVQQPATDLEQVAAIVQRIEHHIHIGEIQSAKYKDGKIIELCYQKNGLISNRAHSVKVNTPNKQAFKQQYAHQTFDETTQKFYTVNNKQDPIAKIYEQAKKLEKTDKNRENLKCIKRKDLTSSIGQILREHSLSIFQECKTIKDIEDNHPKAFALHQAIKAYYKKLLDRSTIQLMHLPKNLQDILTKINQTQNNQDINALIRLGKVIHYQWMNEQQKNQTLDFPTLIGVDVDNSPFWTSLGQFKIKNDEAFLRMWRHCLSLANWSFAHWVNPEQITCKDDKGHDVTDILSQDFFEKAISYEANLNQFCTRANHLFADQATLFNTSDHEKVLRLARYFLNSLRNQVFHFKGLPQFLAENINQDLLGESTLWNKLQAEGKKPEKKQLQQQYQSVLQVLQTLYTSDLEKRAAHLAHIMQGLKVEQCFTRAEWQTLAPHLTQAQSHSDNPLLLPRFSRLWKRANGLAQSDNGAANQENAIFFPPFPTSNQRNSATQPWHQCRYSIIKWIYENEFSNWLHSKGAGKEIKKWFKSVAQNTTQRAQENDYALSIAEKVLNRIGADTITPAKFMSTLISETQKLSGSQQEKHDNQTAAQALENFKLDWYVMAFEKFINSDKLKTVKELLQREANGDEAMIGEGLSMDEKLNFAVIQATLQNTASPTTTGDSPEEVAQKSYTYFILHLMTNDAVSLLRHQLKKWWVLYQQWQNDPAYIDGSFHIDEMQSKLYQRWTSVMDLYLLIQQAQFLRQSQDAGQIAKLPDWVCTLYEKNERGNTDYVGELFHQGNKTLIPFRHLRLLERYGYDQVHKLLQKTSTPLISYQKSVKPWQDRAEEQLANTHQEKERLHRLWVDGTKERRANPKSSNHFMDEQMEAYASHVRHISASKQQQSAVLLQDEFKRYQLLMNVLGRLVDFAGLWERDVAFICCALLHQLPQTQPDVLQPICDIEAKDLRKKLAEGKLSELVDKLDYQDDANSAPTVQALSMALKRMGYTKKNERTEHIRDFSHRPIRNQLAHFGMLHPNQSSLNISQLIDDTRTLMSHDRKLKNAVSYAIVDMFERDGLILKLEFNNHRISAAQISSRMITHLKGEKDRYDAPITEAQHSEHYIDLLRSLFTP